MSEGRTPDIQLLLEQADWLAPLIRGLLRDSHEVEDVLQETWLRALQHPPREEGFVSPRAWLARVALRIALRQRERTSARRWREAAVATPDESVDPEAVAERVRLQRELAERVLELVEPYRTAITLRYLEGMSSAQLAARLGISDAAARKRVSRGLEQLRERLDEANGGDREAWKHALAMTCWLSPRRPPLAPRPARARPWMRPGAWIAVSVIAGAVVLRSLAPADARSPALVAGSADAESTALAGDIVRDSSSAADAADAALRIPLAPSAASSTRQVDAARTWLRGRVIDPAGAPVAGASLEARRPDRSAFDLSAQAPSVRLVARGLSDARGEFALEVPAALLCDLWIDAAPHALALLPDRRAGDDELVQLCPAARLGVSLSEKEGGMPVVGARYRIQALWPPTELCREIAHGLSDAHGRFEVGRLPAGRLLLDVSTENGADVSTVLEVAAGEELERVFRLDAGRVVQGFVLDASSGRPIAAAQVVAAPGRGEAALVPESIGRGWKCRSPVLTDAAGRFRLVATPGFLPSTLFVSARGHGSATVELGTEEQELSITLGAGRAVSGQVLSAASLPVVEARIVAAAFEPGPGMRQLDWKEGSSGADGRFLVEDLRADLGYVLRIAKEGHGARIVTLAAEPAPSEQQLGTLLLPRSPRLAGQVLDSYERPVGGAYVWLRWTNEDPAATRVQELVRTFTRADHEGRFDFADCAPGGLALAASLGGRRTAPHEFVLEVGELREDIRLVFAPLQRISGAVVDIGGTPIANACVLLDPEERVEEPEVRYTGADGRFEFEPAGPGPFGLRVAPNSIHLDGGDALVHSIDLLRLEPGSEDLRIVLPPAELVTGWLLSPHAEPLANVVLFARDARGKLLTYEYTDAEGRFLLRLPPGSVADLSTRTSAEAEIVHQRAVPAGSLDLELVLGQQ